MTCEYMKQAVPSLHISPGKRELKHSGGYVMANFDCQLDHIQNQLKRKVQCTPVRDFLDQVF